MTPAVNKQQIKYLSSHPPTYLRVATPLGNIGVVIAKDEVIALQLQPSDFPDNNPPSSLAVLVKKQLAAYFHSPMTPFDLPLRFIGSEFQCRVWQALRDIPCRHTLTYGELAQRLQTSARAIGNACRTNPIPLIVPCHRVVARGHVGGYAGHQAGKTWQIKPWLLAHEQASVGR